MIAEVKAALEELTAARYALMVASDRVRVAERVAQEVGASADECRDAVLAAYEQRLEELRGE